MINPFRMSKLADVTKEYEKDKNLKKENIENLRLWAEKQPHLPEISELQLILFLQKVYYSNERAKTVIENFFTVRTLWKELSAPIKPNDSSLQVTFECAVVTILPKVAPSGYRVCLMKFLDKNSEKFSYLNQIRIFDHLFTYTMHHEGTNDGFHLVYDGKGARFTHLLRVSPVMAKKFTYYMQEILPIRIRNIHVINPPPSLSKILAFFKPFFSKELFDTLTIHSTLDTFYKIVPQEMMPAEFGGTAGSFKELNELNRRMLEENQDFFEELGKQTTDESKRLKKSTDLDEIFGLEGSFKKLEVD